MQLLGRMQERPLEKVPMTPVLSEWNSDVCISIILLESAILSYSNAIDSAQPTVSALTSPAPLSVASQHNSFIAKPTNRQRCIHMASRNASQKGT